MGYVKYCGKVFSKKNKSIGDYNKQYGLCLCTGKVYIWTGQWDQYKVKYPSYFKDIDHGTIYLLKQGCFPVECSDEDFKIYLEASNAPYGPPTSGVAVIENNERIRVWSSTLLFIIISY